ncbi:LOW QUALITY PROTEIN: uncharacterized protein [Phyllobates terribilis]|uniref:LOW QUALITY PROTEIN: uncharacterized protein n=1 Tax=Phyllobates terribilis TaxID=111132 RepID=UPI003CCB63A3
MRSNISSIETSSDGAWQGDNPLNFAFPLLIVQTVLVLVVSRLLTFFLKPFRQPKVVAEILGGILLGPSALGRNKYLLHLIFPAWSTPILESVASIGLLFFLFLVGLELDLSSIHRTGKRAFLIAFAGISLPFGLSAILTFVLHRTEPTRAQYGQTLVFMGVSLSITAFPVLARILAELKLLTTQVGETAMAAAAFNDVVAWVLLALAIAITGHDGPGSTHKSPITPIWVLASGIAFVGFMMVAVRPAMGFVARKCSSPGHDMVDEAYIGLTLGGVMVSGLVTDLIGIHSIFGAFVFGLTIPTRGAFAGRLIRRIEDFVSVLLLPLYFASSGLKTDLAKISGGGAWGILALVISMACAGKILGTFAVAMLCMIPARDSLALGVLMNTKGLVELIVLNIGREKKVLDDEIFAILVLMALFTTFMTTPAVMAIYKPNRVQSLHSDVQEYEEDDSVRVISCVHGSSDVPSIINLIELISGTKNSSLKLYALHLVELTDRSSSIVMVHRARRNGKPFVNCCLRQEKHLSQMVGHAFEAYTKGAQKTFEVHPVTTISDLPTMHEDICHVAKNKRANIIILPFHKQWRGKDGEEEEMDDLGYGWRMVNQRILHDAPCSVALFVDRGFDGCDPTQKVCVLFFGGSDDRHALDLAGKISEKSTARVTVVRFIESHEFEINAQIQHPLQEICGQRSCMIKAEIQRYSTDKFVRLKAEDEEALEEFNKRWSISTEYIERTIGENVIVQVIEVGKTGAYDLIITGKGSIPSIDIVDRQNEYPELGAVGGFLASSSHGIVPSILVVQHHDGLASDDEALAAGSKMVEKVRGEIALITRVMNHKVKSDNVVQIVFLDYQNSSSLWWSGPRSARISLLERILEGGVHKETA